MALFASLFVAIILLRTAKGEYNHTFCSRFLKDLEVHATQPAPTLYFPNNFHVYVESRSDGERDPDENTFYSATSQSTRTVVDSPLESYTSISIAKTVRSLIWEEENGKLVCDVKHQVGRAFRDISESGKRDKVQLETPEALFGWDSSDLLTIYERRFFGHAEKRGIKTAKWLTCQYSEDDGTSVAFWNVADSNEVTMPLGKESVLLSRQAFHNDGSETWEHFFSFTEMAGSELKTAFERPPGLLCSGSDPFAKPLPTLPDYFSFEMQRTLTMNANGVKYTYVTVESELYDFRNELFYITDVFMPGFHQSDEVEKIRTVIDYNTRTTYVMNYNHKLCGISDHINKGVSSFAASGGFLEMRTPKQFFDFGYDYDSDKYEYTGIHMVRGYECDTWVANFEDVKSDDRQNAEYTWNFMTQKQMEALLHSPGATHRPVSLMVNSPSQKNYYDIFQFQTERSMTSGVNLDLCFPNETYPVLGTVTFPGNSQEVVFKKGYSYFYTAFLQSLQTYTGITTPLRFADILAFPSYFNPDEEFFVSFKLLPLVAKGQDASDNKSTFVETDEALKRLKQSVDSSLFAVTVVYPSQNVEVLRPKPSSFRATGHDPKSKKGGSPSRDLLKAKEGEGYSAGSMAGLAIGMLILGLLLGTVIVVVYKRIVSGTGVNAQFSMKNLSKDDVA